MIKTIYIYAFLLVLLIFLSLGFVVVAKSANASVAPGYSSVSGSGSSVSASSLSGVPEVSESEKSSPSPSMPVQRFPVEGVPVTGPPGNGRNEPEKEQPGNNVLGDPAKTIPSRNGHADSPGVVVPPMRNPLNDGTVIPNSVSCTDSDGGFFPKIAGFVTWDGRSAEDYCVNKGGYWDVIENYCDSKAGVLKSRNFTCLGGCVGGACVDAKIPRSEVRKDVSPPDGTRIEGVAYCSDSDGGVFSEVAGTVTFVESQERNDEHREASDYCFNSTVVEYHCMADAWRTGRNIIGAKFILCENGCYNGACEDPAPVCRGYNTGVQNAKNVKPQAIVSQVADFEGVSFASDGVSEASGKLVNEYNSKLLAGSLGKRALYKAALERKNQMLGLAQEDPLAFVGMALPKGTKDKLPVSVNRFVESEFEGTGLLKVEISEEFDRQTGVIKNSRIEYEIEVGGKQYKLKPARAPDEKLLSGMQVRVKGFVLDDYIVARKIEKIQPRAGLHGTPIMDNKGLLRIAVIKLKLPGGSAEALPKLNEFMATTKQFVEEASYGQTTISWDEYGYFDISQVNSSKAIKAVDPYVDFRNYSVLLFVYSGDVFRGYTAGYGRGAEMTADGVVTLGRISLPSVEFSFETPHIIIHEFGHTLGVFHANFMNCGNKSIDTPNNCVTWEYEDEYDPMGIPPSLTVTHYNGAHKETIGWLDSGRIKEITADGVYTIKSFTSPTGIVVLKIPRKRDDAGKPTEYYYLEYRTPNGFDTQIAQARNLAAGPLLRIERFSHWGDTHLIDMTPQLGVKDEMLSVGNEFIDNIGTHIKTLSADGQTTTVQVTLSTETCTRRTPEISISPTNMHVQVGEQSYFDVKIKNNDSEICPDRVIAVEPIDGNKDISTYSWSGWLIEGQSIDFINILGFVSKSFTRGSVTLGIVDSQFGKLGSQVLNITQGNTELPHWENQDIARKLIYTAKGDGKYVVDKAGKIYRTGNTGFSTDNGPQLKEGTEIAAAMLYANGGMISYFNPLNESMMLIDTKGNIGFAGMSLDYLDFKSTNYESQELSCNVVKDMRLIQTPMSPQLYIMDEYGYVKPMSRWLPSSIDMPCTNWEGKTNAYQEGIRHARAFVPNIRQHSKQLEGYYLLSKDGTIFACGSAKPAFTKYVNKIPQTNSDREAVAMVLDPANGLLVLDSYGSVYTTGTMQFKGEPNSGKNIARDIVAIPNSTGGYAVLLGDGTIHEYR